MKRNYIDKHKAFNKQNNWQDFTVSKPDPGIPCILYDSLDDNMLWVVYEEGHWVDARKGDWDIEPSETIKVCIAHANHTYTDEVHLRYRFWKYIFASPKLTDAISSTDTANTTNTAFLYTKS